MKVYIRDGILDININKIKWYKVVNKNLFL